MITPLEIPGQYWYFKKTFNHKQIGEKLLLLPPPPQPPLEKGVVLHLNKIESTLPRMLCAKLGWNWLRSSGEEVFSMYMVIFHYYLSQV